MMSVLSTIYLEVIQKYTTLQIWLTTFWRIFEYDMAINWIFERSWSNGFLATKFYLHQLMHFFIQTCISLLSYIKIT